ncbi:2,3-diaminopropionate biosynthesis protein SbnA [Kitasatospora sp. NPDC004745]|uniref:2,3-diaminopropionate biosynthesis protein SbnA n=1 Tax=unclassified Kitasatospora TaxID=2633591 RepID=UPI0033DA0EF5
MASHGPSETIRVGAPHDVVFDQVFVDLSPMLGQALSLKCEGFNFAGSVKVKAAAGMVRAAEEAGRLHPGSTIIESSSGSLGIALASIAAHSGYRFVCVTDVRCNERNILLMESLGAEVVVISEPDENGGFLGSRIRHVKEACAADPSLLWLNQYANEGNWRAHYQATAPSIVRSFPDLEFLFVGAGTTGTLTGCGRFLKEIGHPAKVVAVDAVGSITFGGPSGRRLIPGLGSSHRPDIVDESVVDEIVLVEEIDTIRTCRYLAGRGFLFGGSTGTVVSGAFRRLREERPGACAVAISPDFGERYLDTVYSDHWVREHFGDIGRFDPFEEPITPAVELARG